MEQGTQKIGYSKYSDQVVGQDIMVIVLAVLFGKEERR